MLVFSTVPLLFQYLVVLENRFPCSGSGRFILVPCREFPVKILCSYTWLLGSHIKIHDTFCVEFVIDFGGVSTGSFMNSSVSLAMLF